MPAAAVKLIFWPLASGHWLLAACLWLFLNVARIGAASRQLPEASSR